MCICICICNYQVITEFHKYQPQGGLKYLFVKKTSKTEKQKGDSHTKLLQLGEFVNFKMYMNSSLQKEKIPLQLSAVYIQIHQSGGKIQALLKPTSSRKFNNCKFALRDSKKFQKWHSTKEGCLDISNVIDINIAEFIIQQPHGWPNHLLSMKSVKIEKKGQPRGPFFINKCTNQGVK